MDSLRYLIIPLTTATGVSGFLLGGGYVWLGIGTYPVLMFFDIVLPRDAAQRKAHPFFADLNLYAQAPLMIALYAAFALSVKNGSNPIFGEPNSIRQLIGSILSLGWLSAVPTLPVAHELMHRKPAFPRFCAKVLSTFYGDTNRDVAHVRTHHIHLNTAKDSDTPVRGQTIYGFVVQATIGSYKDAWEWSAEKLRRKRKSVWDFSNPVWIMAGLTLLLLGSVWFVAGSVATIAVLLSMTLAKALVEGFNYFQHYGLIREEGAHVEIHHAWNHLGAIVRPLGCEITNHINHHKSAATPFYKLRAEPNAPQMPSLFVCFLTALIPPLWTKLIAQPKLEDWDQNFASPKERELAAKANLAAGWPLWLDADKKTIPSATAD